MAELFKTDHIQLDAMELRDLTMAQSKIKAWLNKEGDVPKSILLDEVINLYILFDIPLE